jgi:hypothetical protein
VLIIKNELNLEDVQGVIKEEIGEFYCFEYQISKRWVIILILFTKKNSIAKRITYTPKSKNYFRKMKFSLNDLLHPTIGRI